MWLRCYTSPCDLYTCCRNNCHHLTELLSNASLCNSIFYFVKFAVMPICCQNFKKIIIIFVKIFFRLASNILSSFIKMMWITILSTCHKAWVCYQYLDFVVPHEIFCCPCNFTVIWKRECFVQVIQFLGAWCSSKVYFDFIFIFLFSFIHGQ